MEGLADDVLREVLTRVEGYAHAVTEFARVSGLRVEDWVDMSSGA
jgi:tRNA-dihydrouridine synthase C